MLKVFLFTDDDIVYQEIALYKVPTHRLLEEQNLESIIRHHGARILEMTPEYTVLEKPATLGKQRPSSTACDATT